jgi:hypothetical protein
MVLDIYQSPKEKNMLGGRPVSRAASAASQRQQELSKGACRIS